MKGYDLKNHFSLMSSNQVSEICNDILKSLSITYFNYIKIYNDGSRALLTNNSPWIEHFYKNALYNTKAVVDIEYLLPKGYFLWSELKNDDQAFIDGREFFNIDNGISFVVKHSEYTVLYIFASSRNNEVINSLYIRNIDLLKRFILYFKDKGHKLIEEATKNRIILPEKQIITNKEINKIYLSDQTKKEFFAKTNMERFFLINKTEDIYLTKRQAECAVLVVDGLSSKEIAKKLNLSFRTVETYIEQIKTKLSCTCKDDLINEIRSSGLKGTITIG